jgi:hypothetical protein
LNYLREERVLPPPLPELPPDLPPELPLLLPPPEEPELILSDEPEDDRLEEEETCPW